MSSPIVSIVLCTYKREDLFQKALQSLLEQEVNPALYEIIVADSELSPNETVKKITLTFVDKYPVRYLHEPKVGLSNARTSGGKLAQADYVCYFDDDALAEKKYFQKIISIIEKVHPDIFGGPYYPFYQTSKPDWFQDKYGAGANFGPEQRLLEYPESFAGANVIFKKSVLEAVGWFNPKLSMSGKKMYFGSETMTQLKAWAQYPDLTAYYDPELIVLHLVPSRKMSVRFYLRMRFVMGNSQAYFWISPSEDALARTDAPLKLLKTVFVLGIKTLPGLLFRNRRQYPCWQNYIVEDRSRYFGIIGAQVRLIRDLFKGSSREEVFDHMLDLKVQNNSVEN